MFIISNTIPLVKRFATLGARTERGNSGKIECSGQLEKVYFVHSIKEDCILFSLLGNCGKAHGFVSVRLEKCVYFVKISDKILQKRRKDSENIRL